jgi:hypothetical protein
MVVALIEQHLATDMSSRTEVSPAAFLDRM